MLISQQVKLISSFYIYFERHVRKDLITFKSYYPCEKFWGDMFFEIKKGYHARD